MSHQDAWRRKQADLEAEQGSVVLGEDGDCKSLKLTLLPLRHSKIIHLVRHGQGFHNVAGEVTEDSYKEETYFDAQLTARGWAQAADLKAHVQASNSHISPEVVIVSPLMRAMQTAAGAFGGGLWDKGHSAMPLMQGGNEQQQISAAHPAIAASEVQFVACELCREHTGKHPCDRRRSVKEYREKFPGVDFSGLQHDNDVLWKADVRESDECIANRGIQFLHWLSNRPETEIAVVSHSGFLHNMLSNFAGNGSDSVRNDLQRLFANCELRTVVLGAADSDGNLDSTWFHPEGFHDTIKTL